MQEGILYIVLAFILAIDLLFVSHKFKKQGFFPALIDIVLLLVINSFLGGSLGGEIIGTVAAFIISVYLWFNPPRLTLMFGSRNKAYR